MVLKALWNSVTVFTEQALFLSWDVFGLLTRSPLHFHLKLSIVARRKTCNAQCDKVVRGNWAWSCVVVVSFAQCSLTQQRLRGSPSFHPTRPHLPGIGQLAALVEFQRDFPTFSSSLFHPAPFRPSGRATLSVFQPRRRFYSLLIVSIWRSHSTLTFEISFPLLFFSNLLQLLFLYALFSLLFARQTNQIVINCWQLIGFIDVALVW